MSRAVEVDSVRSSLHTEEELLRKLPEINEINDKKIRDSVIRTFLKGCPDYFWTRPSSSSGKYHSVDERGKHGNWIHTKRVFAEYCNISESWIELDVISEQQREEGKAAALVHDMMKYGWPSDGNDHTVDNHDLIAADVARNIGEMPESIVRLIEVHMGPWGQGPNPESPMERLFHTADKSAARESNDVGIYYPSDEILEEWPAITVDEIEDGETL